MRKWRYCILILILFALLVLPVASAENGKIAFTFTSIQVAQWEIYSMNADGTGQTLLTNIGSDNSNPAWSPDGTKIAYTFGSQIYVMNADGTGQTQLNYNYVNGEPAWSPDGTKIAFTRFGYYGNPKIYIMNAEGTEQTQLTNNPFEDREPAWSPDGTKIAFQSGDRYPRPNGGQYIEVYVVNVDGTGQTRLTHDYDWDGEPAWSPDGTKIAFTKAEFVGSQIYVMNADGTGQTRLTNNPGLNQKPAWGRVPATNQAPVLKNPGDQVIAEGNILTLNLQANDPDNDPITYSFVSDEPLIGATLTGDTFTWVSPLGSAGTYSLTFKASDSGGLSDEKTIIITVYVPVKVRIVPNTINIASKGKFVAFITLPSNYKAADVDPKSVECEGAPALRIIQSKWFPHTFAAIFSRDILVNVKPEDKVQLTVTGTINKNGQNVGFSGSDVIKVISKKVTIKETIDDVEKMTDEKVFSQFNPR